ncbi:MAG: XdhC family protein [Pseudomonadota bacterium]
MILDHSSHNSTRQVLEALIQDPGSVLAVISGVEGPSYRPKGAMMAVLDGGRRVGSLSSGCIEADISRQAEAARDAGVPRSVRYGAGSPFVDIALPCGGGLDILLVPEPDRTVLKAALDHHASRRALTLWVDPGTGQMSLEGAAVGPGGLSILIEPELRFVVFGKGPEACAFSALVQSVGYPNLLVSPDDESRAVAGAAGCETRPIDLPAFPSDLSVDARTAIVLFFHDHDWEPPILDGALGTDAFYIGAQGSWNAREARLASLRALGQTEDALARLYGPVGVIPSARDARTLAVSVLAEILGKALVRDQ